MFAAIVIVITNAVIAAGRVDAAAVDAGIVVAALVDVHLAQITFETWGEPEQTAALISRQSVQIAPR